MFDPRNTSPSDGVLYENEVIGFFRIVLTNGSKRWEYLSNSCDELECDIIILGQGNTQQFMSIVESTPGTSSYTEKMLSYISRLCADLEEARNVSEQAENERNQMFQNYRSDIKRRLESDVYKDEYTMEPYYELDKHISQRRTSIKEITTNILNLKESKRMSVADVVNERNNLVKLNVELGELKTESNAKIEQIKMKMFTNEFKQDAVIKNFSFPIFNI